MRRTQNITPTQTQELTPALVFTATVVSVDTERYEMVVRSSHMAGLSRPLEIPSMFMNVRDGSGAGIHVLPEEGSEVWICKTSDGTYVPLLYHGAMGTSYRNHRPNGVQGDIVLSTSDGNSVKVGKGGSVALTASPVCHMMLSPVDDCVYTMASQTKAYTLGSSVEHVVDDARRTTSFYRYFEMAEQTSPSVAFHMGSLNSEVVYASMVTPYDTKDTHVVYNARRDGSVFYETTGNIDLITADLTTEAQNIHVTGLDVHFEPELATVGNKANSDFLVKSTQLLADLSALCTALQQIGTITPIAALVSSGDAATIAAIGSITTATTTIMNNIASGVYPTNKLKSE